MSVFAEPLTQVREATVRNGVCLVCGSGVLDGEHLRDDLDCALDRVERLATDMETALQSAMRELERVDDVRANRTRIIGNAHRILHAAAFAADRAVLSAREEGAV